MRQTKDHFSSGSKNYQKFRPTYPDRLYQDIYGYLDARERAWDCATGNGQVATVLANTFQEVHATDISHNQLSQAPRKKNISYQISRAEQTPFPDDFFDLITVAQALHWFDHEHFFKEARRVAKGGSILAVWGYGLLSIEPSIDPVLEHLCNNILGTYWDFERTHVNNQYENILSTSTQEVLESYYTSTKESSLQELEGYLYTWSSVKAYLKQHDHDPVQEAMKAITAVWGEEERKLLKFPVFLKVHKVIK